MPDRGPSELWKMMLPALYAALDSTPRGLAQAEAVARLSRHGRNDAIAVRRPPLWRRFLSQLGNPLVLLLLIASALAALLGELSSFALVATIVVLSVAIDLVQERRAERAIDALQRSVAVRTEVSRDGALVSLPVDLLVPGDVVHLAAGDLAPADCRLIEAHDLFVNQALLTGESFPVEKVACELPGAGEPSEAVNTLFMGSSVLTGSGVALVCRTGRATFLAQFAGSLAEQAPPDAFQLGIRAFGMLMLRVTLFLVLFVLLVSLAFHRPWLDSLMFALALAVGLTPELLPAIVTVTLARGAVRLARRAVVVKRLPAMHNLGAMDVLCTDKTGTLTEAKIHLARHVDHRGEESERVFRLAWLNSHFESGIRSPLDDAILEHGHVDAAEWRKIDEAPFDFGRRRISVLLAQNERRLLVVKGAPEDVLRVADRYEAAGPDDVRPLDATARERIEALFSRLGDEGLRVLAIAIREVAIEHGTAVPSGEAQLVFVGYAVFLDPPKPSATKAIGALTAAGVRIKVLTGDNERVTRHVCGELGLGAAELITGDALSRLSDEALLAQVDRIDVFARVTPQQKHRILLALKRRGRRVGFLGDGVNDAAALHAADVGVSVDSAADVAKEAADVILLERDLGVVSEAVMEGRRTVRNVTKYVLMGVSSNFGNMISMAGAALFLPFLPMLPVQVLLNNLLYDCSELGIPFDEVEAEELVRPVHWDLAEVQRAMLILGPISSVFDFLTFFALIALFGAAPALFQTAWFVESLATQALVIFAIRSRRGVFASRPHPLLAALALGAVAVAGLLPLTPLGASFGFVAPPLALYPVLALTVAAYLALVIATRPLVYRR